MSTLEDIMGLVRSYLDGHDGGWFVLELTDQLDAT